MASAPSPPTSFSSRRRWGLFLSVQLSIVAVAAIVVMLNYLGARHYLRMNWSAPMMIHPSPQTIAALGSVTNDVRVIVYYDKKDRLYSFIVDLLNEYHLINSKISVRTVDYIAQPVVAQEIRSTYRLTAATDKNLIIFDAGGGNFTPVSGDRLGSYSQEMIPGEKERTFRKKLDFFIGDDVFRAALLRVINPKPWIAYFLTGHGEGSPAGRGDYGYARLKEFLQFHHVESTELQLIGTNDIPADCNLLVVAGPQRPIPAEELAKLQRYLEQGGRLLAMFSVVSMKINTGLEDLLRQWGVAVGHNYVIDEANTEGGGAVVVWHFHPKHPLVNPLLSQRLVMIQPRSIQKLESGKQAPNAPVVEELAFSGDRAKTDESILPAGRGIPLAVAVEGANSRPATMERGRTRMVVVGDSFFLSNGPLELEANRDFAEYAVNWLLNQTPLIVEAGRSKVVEYRMVMTRAQMGSIQWIFLAAMPGAILLLGGLVWLRRRH